MSSGRQKNLRRLRGLVPRPFTVFVSRNEEAEYLKYVSDGIEIRTHTRCNKNPVEIRQNILDAFVDDDYIVFIDDDLREVVCLVGQRGRVYKDTDVTRRLIENGIQMCEDLGKSFFAWNRNPNAMYFQSGEPLKMCRNFLGAAFIVKRGVFRFDTSLDMCGDVDLTLQGLLKERIVLFDARFYFCFGPTGRGAGGMQKVRSSESMKKSYDYIKDKWGKWCEIRYRKNTNSIHLAIERKSPLATLK